VNRDLKSERNRIATPPRISTMKPANNDDLAAEQAVDQAAALSRKLSRVCERSDADLEVAALALAKVLGSVLAVLRADAEQVEMALEFVQLAVADGAKALHRGALQ
jgi:hypothetical protein